MKKLKLLSGILLVTAALPGCTRAIHFLDEPWRDTRQVYSKPEILPMLAVSPALLSDAESQRLPDTDGLPVTTEDLTN